MFYPEDLKNELKAERRSIDGKLRDMARSTDTLTRRIKGIVDQNVASFLPRGTVPESGDVNKFMSLVYGSPAQAIRLFNEDNPFVYARNGIPHSRPLAQIAIAIDPGTAAAALTNWGMGAVNAVISKIKIGQHVVASKFLFGGVRVLLNDLKDRGAEVSFIDGRDLEAWKSATKPNTAMYWFETPGNPTMQIVDIKAVADIAHANDILVFVDNSLAWSAHKPLELGADGSASSLTKALGFGSFGGGLLAMSEAGIARHKRVFGLPEDSNKNLFFNQVAYTGATLSSGFVAAGLMLNARHLPKRFERQVENATLLATHLREHHDGDISVIHPAIDTPHPQMNPGTSVFSIDVRDNPERAKAFINILTGYGVRLVNNFGQGNTYVTLPAPTTHHSLSADELEDQGITSSMIRITVGIEKPEVLLPIFDVALDESAGRAPRRHLPIRVPVRDVP